MTTGLSIGSRGRIGRTTALTIGSIGRLVARIIEVIAPRRQPRVVGIPDWFFNDDDEVLIELD
jgi:hypothetical protein